MNRNAQATRALAAALATEGVTLSGRTISARALEDLSHKGVLLESETTEQTVYRLRELAKLGYGSGKSTDQIDHMLRVLLARGYPCEAARLAIYRKLTGDTEPPTWLAGDTASPQDQPGTRAVTDLARHLEEWSYNPSLLMAPLVRRVAQETRQGGRTDHAGALVGPLEETLEQRHWAMSSSLANGISGRDAGDLSPWIDLQRISARRSPLRAREDPGFEEEEQVLETFDKLPRLTQAFLRILFTFPLQDLTSAARMCRPLLGEALPLMGLHLDDEALDDAAACYGPVFLVTEAEHLKQEDPEGVAKWKARHRAELAEIEHQLPKTKHS